MTNIYTTLNVTCLLKMSYENWGSMRKCLCTRASEKLRYKNKMTKSKTITNGQILERNILKVKLIFYENGGIVDFFTFYFQLKNVLNN